MKNFLNHARIAAIIISVIVWGIVGVKIYNNDYNFTVEVIIGAICYAVILLYAFCRIANTKCPHCNRHLLTTGKFCPNCGKEI